MKTLLMLLVAATASGYYAAQSLSVVYGTAKPTAGLPAQDAGNFALGLRALSGELARERLAEILPEHFAPVSSHPTAPAPQTTIPPLKVVIPALTVKRPAIVAAWADSSGRLYCRLDDGTTCRRLASGELAPVQPTSTAERDSVSETK